MSADAGRICNWCRIPNRGVYGELGDGKLICGPCFAALNSPPAASTDADRIAALEAELAEAQENERRINRERAALCTSLDQERAAHERTKAELVAEHADRLNIDEHRGRLLRERDAAQAQAAAMRRKIEYYVDYPDSRCNSGDNGGCVTAQQLHAAIGDAGRALAARVPLWRELEKLVTRETGMFRGERIGEVLRALAALDAQEPK